MVIKMKVMTFNIQHCLDYKKQLIDFDLFANAIRKCGADVCGLNEVRGEGPVKNYTDQTNILGDKLGFYRYFGEAIKVDGTSPYGNAIVSKYPVKFSQTIKIPDPVFKVLGGSYETRCIIKTIINIDGVDVCFLVTHMGLVNSERKNAVKSLCEILDEITLPVILMGDFNSVPDDKVFTPLRERLSDTQEKSVNPEVKTYPSDKPCNKIDYIFYRGLTCIKTETVSEIYSDHLPITAEFTV